MSKNTIQKNGMSLYITVVFHRYLKIVWNFVAGTGLKFLGTGLKFSYLFAAAKIPVWLLAVWENIPICHHLGKAWNARWGLEPIDFIDTLSSKYFSHKHEVASHVLFFPSPSPSLPIQTLAIGQWKENLIKPPSPTDTLFGLQSLIGVFSYLLGPLLSLIMSR